MCPRAPSALFVLGALVSACSSATDPGGGSGTLLVVADVYGKPDSTRVEVRLEKDGEVVRGANVVARDLDTGELHTLEATGSGASLRYEAILRDYLRRVRFEITSGDDVLDGGLEGPAPHQITRPPDNAIVRRGSFENLKVEWEAEDLAQGVLVSPDGAPALELAGDRLSAEVPLSGLADGDQRIRVERFTQVELAGGIGGSHITSRYKVDNRFTLE